MPTFQIFPIEITHIASLDTFRIFSFKIKIKEKLFFLNYFSYICNMITINNYIQFRKSYDLALNEGKEVFIFEGSEVLTDYAKYVIQYFESKI